MTKNTLLRAARLEVANAEFAIHAEKYSPRFVMTKLSDWTEEGDDQFVIRVGVTCTGVPRDDEYFAVSFQEYGSKHDCISHGPYKFRKPVVPDSEKTPFSRKLRIGSHADCDVPAAPSEIVAEKN